MEKQNWQKLNFADLPRELGDCASFEANCLRA